MAKIKSRAFEAIRAGAQSPNEARSPPKYGTGAAARLIKKASKQGILSRLRPIKSKERSYEYRLRDHLEANYPVFFVKSKPTRKSWPDRQATGYGQIRLVELKRQGEDLDEAQVIMHRELRSQGIRVVRIHTGMSLDLAAKLVVRALQTGV